MTYTPIPAGAPNWDVPVNAAFTDQDTRITNNGNSIAALQAQGSTSNGIYIPPNWGQFWRPARNNAALNGARVIAIGDSVTQGYYCSNTRTTSWVGRMRATLQGNYGNGGSGMIPSSNTALVVAPSAGVISAWEANDSFAILSGAWSAGTLFIGPGITYLAATNAATATFKVTGTVVRIFNIDGPAPRAAWTYSIDGGAPVNVPGVVLGNLAVKTTTITGLSNAQHTVTISWNGVNPDVLHLIGVEGHNTTGVVVDNMGRSGSNTTQWASSTATTSAPDYNGGPSYPADLAIVSLGINDATGSATIDTYLKNLGTNLATIKRANNGATDIILLQAHYGSQSAYAFYSAYSAQIRGLADTYGAAVVNMWEIGRNSWDYWNSFGYWGDLNTPGPTGTNSVHPGDLGHQFIADTITPIVMS